MNLYLLTTRELGDFYVISTNPTSAEQMLYIAFARSDYGFEKNRKIENIQLVAEQITDFPDNKPNFSSGNKLLLERNILAGNSCNTAKGILTGITAYPNPVITNAKTTNGEY